MSERVKLHITPIGPDSRRLILDALRWVILGLSLALIVFISVDTFEDIDFINDMAYMKFQFYVCLVFIADFFIELALTPRDSIAGYIRRRWLYLFLSVPYLSIIDHYNIDVNADIAYFLRFVPLARGALALAIIYNYMTKNMMTTIVATYVSILVTVIYFASLIFFEREQPVNPSVTSFWEALWWGGMQATTLGCDIYPVTVAGKILSVVLSVMGMIMFPLFTVYVTDVIVRRHSQDSAV